jgi:hypothetical protein
MYFRRSPASLLYPELSNRPFFNIFTQPLTHTQQTTPAMAAGITDHCWTMYELLSFHVPLSRWVPPKRRGRPSRALQHLIKRWCS